MPGKDDVIELKMDIDGVYKSKSELRRDIKPKKKMERAFVNNSNKINQFLFGVETGVDILVRLNKIFK